MMVIEVFIDEVNIINKLEKYRDNKIIILGHEHPDVDSIVSGYLLEKVLLKEGFNASFCITDKTISKESLDFLNRYDFDASKYQFQINHDNNTKYILVDNNSRICQGEIIAIIDHHPISEKFNIEMYFNKPISSTALYICKNNEYLFDKKDITLAILATMLDTASFNSTKSREEDKVWVLNMCQKLNLDYDKLYKIGLYLTPLDDLKQCSLNGLKKYNYNNHLVESSYVQIGNEKGNDYKIESIINILKEYVKEKNLDMFVFIVHNMIELKTTTYKIKSNNIEVDKYSKYTSRGNDIMPSIEKEFIKLKKVIV